VNFFQRKFSFVIIAGSLVLTLGVFCYGLKIISDLGDLRKSEAALFQKSQELDEHLSQFQRAMGFGGFIHNVKEYLIYRNPRQLFILEANVNELEDSITKLKQSFTTPESAQAIGVLGEFVSTIRGKLELLRSVQGQKADITNLNKMLGLETPETLSALVTLESLKNKYYHQAAGQVKSKIDEIVRDLFISGVLLPLLLALGGFLAWMLNQAITAKEQLEATRRQLINNQHLLEATGQMAKVGGWKVDAMTYQARWTSETHRIYGSPPDWEESLSFEKVTNFFPPPSRKIFESAMQEALANGKSFDLELPLVDAQGKERLVGLFCHPSSRESAEKLYIAIQDVTERKSLEERLRQSEKLDSIGRLAGGVAHDFNNMLGVIIGNAELAKMKAKKSASVEDNLEQILQAANRSRDITRQLLAFARKQILTPKVLDLNASLEGMLKMLRNLLGENIDLSWNPKENLWPVRIDPSQLDQVLANLCINARDAIADVGKMTIETDAVSLDEDYCKNHQGFIPGDYTMFAVSDNGCGMDRETQKNIFEPFFTTKKFGEGTGLGMATIHGIVKQSNGFISVYSEPDQGTTFKIYLPRCVEEIVVEKEETVNEVPMGHGETVMLVEDEAAIMKLVKTILEDLGYSVLAANSPEEAITLAESHPDEIQLLLTDVVMPGMNGRDLAKQVRDIHPEMKALYMSGYTDTANVIAHHGVLDEGINFIQKPFSRLDLSIHVREILDSNA